MAKKKRTHKKQHWVPRSYLTAWCDPEKQTHEEPFVWVFDKEGSEAKRRAPANLFTASDLYTLTLEGGGRDLRIEHGLSGLEDHFARLRKDVLTPRKPLRGEHQLLLRAFFAATQARSRLQLNHWRQEWGGLLERIETLRTRMEEATPREREIASRMARLSPSRESVLSESDIRALVQEPQQNLADIVQMQTTLLASLHLTILCTKSDPGFITFDSPCVWFDPEMYNRPFPYNSVGLMYDTVEITLPVSPFQLAVLSYRELNPYLDIPDRIVDEFNRRTRFFCESHFVVRRNILNPIWLDPGHPPEPAG